MKSFFIADILGEDSKMEKIEAECDECITQCDKNGKVTFYITGKIICVIYLFINDNLSNNERPVIDNDYSHSVAVHTQISIKYYPLIGTVLIISITYRLQFAN